MATLRHIKQKIGAIRKLGQVTQAMEAVAAVKMRRTQERAWHLRPYMQIAAQLSSVLTSSMERSERTLHSPNPQGKLGVVVITADRGLAGALNANVLRAVQRSFRERSLGQEDVILFAIGKRGAEFFARRHWEVALRQERWGDVVPFEEIRSLADSLLLRWGEGSLREVEVWYSYYKSPFEQRPRSLRLLPLDPSALREAAGSVFYQEGTLLHKVHTTLHQKERYGTMTFAPSPEAVAENLLPLTTAALLAHAVAESAASEQAARMVAMKNATERGGELVEGLTLEFNKARQAGITRELSELVASMEAMQ